MPHQSPIQLTPEEEADLREAEAEIEHGDIASPEEVRAMWAKHGLIFPRSKFDVDRRKPGHDE